MNLPDIKKTLDKNMPCAILTFKDEQLVVFTQKLTRLQVAGLGATLLAFGVGSEDNEALKDVQSMLLHGGEEIVLDTINLKEKKDE